MIKFIDGAPSAELQDTIHRHSDLLDDTFDTLQAQCAGKIDLVLDAYCNAMALHIMKIDRLMGIYCPGVKRGEIINHITKCLDENENSPMVLQGGKRD